MSTTIAYDNQQPHHLSRKESWQNNRQDISHQQRRVTQELDQQFTSHLTASVIEQTDNFYSEKHIKRFLQYVALVLNRLRTIIESGSLENGHILMQFIRKQLHVLINGEIDDQNNSLNDYLYHETASKLNEINRLAPTLNIPYQKPIFKSESMMPFDNMVHLYNGLKMSYEIILSYYEYFSPKSWFENCFNGLFEPTIFKTSPNWLNYNHFSRKTMISVMHRLSLILNFIGLILKRGQLMDEKEFMNAINYMMKPGPVEKIQGFERFKYPYHEHEAAERREILDDFINGFKMPKTKPVCPPDSNLICFEKMLHLYEGFEAAYWMIEDEFDRQIFSQRHIVDVINRSVGDDFKIFPHPDQLKDTPFPFRKSGKCGGMRYVIQRIVILLGILRKELESGKLIPRNVFNTLKTQFLDNLNDTSVVEKYLQRGLYIHKSGNYVELEINRLLPAIKIPPNRPLASNQEAPYSEVLRFYFRLQKCALRFLRWTENDFFSKPCENVDWIRNRLKECLSKYILESEGANCPENNEACPAIYLDPPSDVEDFHDYASEIKPGNNNQFLRVPKK